MNTPLVSAAYGDIPQATVAPENEPPVEIIKPIAVEGYGVASDSSSPYSCAPPPPTANEGASLEINTVNDNSLTDSALRSALAQVVDTHCCWSKNVYKNMIIKTADHSDAFYIIWETFNETRSTAWTSEPYRGQNIDTPNMGMAPLPWSIAINGPDYFINQTQQVHVPHTDSVSSCLNCNGRGRIVCDNCNGRGSTFCNTCNGSGHNGDNRCSFCNGNGRRRCSYCSGSGRLRCHKCDGHGRVVNFVQLTVVFKNNVFERVIDISGMPSEELKKGQGELLCQQKDYLLNPPTNHPDQRINGACIELFNQSKNFIQSSQGRLLQQRVTVSYIPVTKAIATRKDKDFTFYVYGLDNKAFTNEYPATCCGCLDF
ncbi:hypothetical protein WA158_002760 [Blastocystis sp. Blastoise]